MGMPYAELRILDKNEDVYIEFPSIRFYAGSNASDFSQYCTGEVLSLNALLTNNGHYAVKALEVNLNDKTARLADNTNSEDKSFVEVNRVLEGLSSIQADL